MKKNYLCLCLFVDYRKKVRKTWACQTWVPYYKELELGKLEYHRRKKKTIMLEFCIYKELKFSKLKYCVAWNSSLPNSSSMWHFFNKKIHINTSFFIIYLYILFYETRVFKTRFTQKTWVLWTRVSKKWYIASYFVKNGMLLIISAKSGKWPIWPSYRNKSLKPKYDLF